MRLRRAFTVFGGLISLVIIVILYSGKNLLEFPSNKRSIAEEFQENKWLHFQDKIKQLEADLNKHNEAVDEIRNAMKLLQPGSSTLSVSRNSSGPFFVKPLRSTATEVIYEGSCPFQVNIVPRPNIQMLEMYKLLNFDNIDGGAWKQGWKIEVDEREWSKTNKLKIFVVPHSHNDPGWIKTLDEYYISQTKHILNNMLNKLPEDPRRRFIWAEISYFSMWWEDINDDDREKVKRLIRNNQLEIVSGGWVMNDEANSHWISTIQQYTEGHQWLQVNLNYTPLSSWSIDPFGMSFAQAALLKEMGFQNMLIQRVHYSVKKQLASQKQLEFRWRQLWDGTGKTDMFTHMMPFYSYDVPHTCGPDPKVCCQFDFKRLPGHGLHCPWKIAPQPITDKNVAQKAAMLLDQYRKKSKLYKTNVVLAPLGDDFRYDHHTEWDVQYENYQKLFDYMNGNLNLHVQAQFGSLTDYFNAVKKEISETDFPTLSGDFFTYADRDDHYWSGYYTSRPFYKRMDRVLLSYLRAAEIILTLTHLSGKSNDLWLMDKDSGLEGVISKARKELSLFQHHDGIAGTERDHVVVDYAKRMLMAIKGCQRVLQHCTNILLDGPKPQGDMKDAIFYHIDDVRHAYNELEEHYQITIGPELGTMKVVIFNSLTFARAEVVTFYVSTPFVEVLDVTGKIIECQISPIFEYASSISHSKYQLSFIVNIPSLSLLTYTINSVWEHKVPPETKFSKIKIYNLNNEVRTPKGFNKVETFASPSEFTLYNSRITASFGKFGLLKALKTGNGTVPVHLDFVKYGARFTQETSGAYLFLPDGPATLVKPQNTIVNVVEGPIVSFVVVQLPYVRHTVRLFNTLGSDGLGIEIENIVDITKTSNFELAMKFSTSIQSGDEFFTDVNGYQLVRRKRFMEKLPIQANYYPMPAMAYIEDKNTRLTVVTSGPLGCSSMKSGQLEIMMDRRLKQDDNRGLRQGVMDNVPTRHIFRVLLETKTQPCQATPATHPAGFATLSAHVNAEALLSPLVKLLRNDDEDTVSKPGFTDSEGDFGVDFSLASLRSGVYLRGKDYLGMIIHRRFVDVCFADRVLLQQFPLSHGVVNVTSLVPALGNYKVRKSSLTFLTPNEEVDLRKEVSLCPMEMQAYMLNKN